MEGTGGGEFVQALVAQNRLQVLVLPCLTPRSATSELEEAGRGAGYQIAARPRR